MAAGTLPYQKTGKDFLSSSHFTIGMDSSFLEDTKTSANKLAFQDRGPVSVDQVAAKNLGDSQLMHSSSHYNKQAVSQTKDSYRSMGVATREWNDYSGRLNTNFLSHSDSQCISFQTTAQDHFKPENALKFDKKEQKSLMTSSVPSGDKDKVRIPLSEVHDSYPGQNVGHIRPNRYPEHIDYGIIDTLKTDRRQPPPYRTTNQELHSGQFDPAIKQPYGEAALKRGTHAVGLGNETTPQHTTNVRDEYVPQDFTTKRYNKSAAVSKVLGTTFLFGSETPHNGSLTHTDTTNLQYHTGRSYGPTQSMKPDNVFESSFPEGDRHPERTKQLQNDTSYGEHFPVRAPGVILNPKVKGEEIITKSKVVLGTDNPVLSASTQSCYVSQLAHVKPRDRVDQLVKFQNGFSLGSQTEYREAPVSEIKDNFKSNADHQKFAHKATVLGRLKDSHLILTHDAPNEYSTTYNSLFVSKKPDPQGLAPKLQSSSVPLGNFSRYTTPGR